MDDITEGNGVPFGLFVVQVLLSFLLSLLVSLLLLSVPQITVSRVRERIPWKVG